MVLIQALWYDITHGESGSNMLGVLGGRQRTKPRSESFSSDMYCNGLIIIMNVMIRIYNQDMFSRIVASIATKRLHFLVQVYFSVRP